MILYEYDLYFGHGLTKRNWKYWIENLFKITFVQETLNLSFDYFDEIQAYQKSFGSKSPFYI